MSNDLSGGGFAILGAILGIWGLVAVVFYVWYLWALSKLFPYLGLPSSSGWIPVWNQWQLLQRAGLPGWVVLLGFVPPLTIVAIVVSIMAVHRLNREFGKDAAYTVLGAFLPPIWAMLLASHIADGVYAGASVYTGEAAFPPLAPAPRPVPSWPAPVAPGGPVAPPLAQAPVAQTPAAAPGDAALQGLPPVPPGALQAAPPRAAAPGTADPHAMNDWGFSNTTEGNFERLAAEHLDARPAPPLGMQAPPQPFAWPGDDPDPVPAPAAAPGAAPAGAGAPDAPETAGALGASHAALPEADPARADAATRRPGHEVPDPAPVTAPDPAPVAAPDPASVTAPDPVPAAAPVLAADAGVIPGSEGAPRPVPGDPRLPTDPTGGVTDPGAAGFAAADLDDAGLDDRTVLVTPPARWGLELPDGETLELIGDDLVVGRKPERLEGADILAVTDPTRTVSKSHVRLRYDGESWTVEDLNSTNGLAVADESGGLTQLPAGLPLPAPERMVLGTLEVWLRRL